ncbi:MAG TPA: cell division protein SepF [Clostridia bacterium]|jgi:cell division inhibitor SepF|nr:cell division protein SepF [Clostridia bacterium]
MRALDRFLDIMGFSEVEEEIHFEEEETPEYFSRWKQPAKNKGQVIPLASKRSNQVVLLEPLAFDDCQLIADHLKGSKIIVINLESVDGGLARRIIDFVGGTTYALGGCLQKVGSGTIIATPNNVDISGDLNSVSQPKEVFAWINKIINQDPN